MKKAFILVILAVFYGCSIKPPPSCLPYLIWPKEDLGDFRMYQSKGDTTTTILATQKVSYTEDSAVTLEYVFLREDTVPINKSEEIWFPDNSMQLVSNSFYEFDATVGFAEVRGIRLGDSKWNLEDDFSFDLKYQFRTDPGLTMITHSTYQINKANIDSIFREQSNCIVINSTTNTDLKYTDGRTDTTIASSTTRIYKLNKGLVYFSLSKGRKTHAYQLIEN